MSTLIETGITFDRLYDDESRGRIVPYKHGAPSIDRSKAHRADIVGLSNYDRKNVLDSDEARFTIGFEIEKNRLHRNSLREYPVFARFETDASCGFEDGVKGHEAITHILPLIGRSLWRTKVYNMFNEAHNIIDDAYSPSNAKCGGHIHLACKGMYPHELMDRVRRFSGVVYAIYRKRIGNYYCIANMRMHDVMRIKYSVAKTNDYGIEFRIPSRVMSVKQIMRRYELMYTIMDFACNTPSGDVTSAEKAKFRSAVMPIIVSMCEGDKDKAKAIYDLGMHFQDYINTGIVNKHTIGWLERRWSTKNYRKGTYYDFYTRGLDSRFNEYEWVNEQRAIGLL